MRCLGILSVRNETEEQHKKREKWVEAASFHRGVPVVVAETSINKEGFAKKSPGQKKRFFKKGEKCLRRMGADVIVPTLLSSRIFSIPVQGDMTVETPLTRAEMPSALELVLSEYRDSPKGKTGWIVDRQCSMDCLPLLIALSQRVEFLNIVTKEREKAEKLGEILWEEYGVVPDIYQELRGRDWKNTIVLQMDQGRILVDGLTVLQGVRWSLDLEEYRIDLPGLLSRCPELWSVLETIGWCRGKSG